LTNHIRTLNFLVRSPDWRNTVKRPIAILVICVGMVLVAAGCGKNDAPPLPKVAEQPRSAATGLAEPALPPPALPEINVSKGPDEQAPHPGQVNDTSSPAFMNGGKADPHK
jgi:hypothetical protein